MHKVAIRTPMTAGKPAADLSPRSSLRSSETEASSHDPPLPCSRRCGTGSLPLACRAPLPAAPLIRQPGAPHPLPREDPAPHCVDRIHRPHRRSDDFGGGRLEARAKDGARFARRAGYPRPFGTPDQQRQPLVGEQRGEGLNGGRLRFSNDDAFDLVAPQAAVRLDEAWVRGRSMADPIAAHTVTGVRQNRTACAREAKALPAVLHPWSGSTRTRRGAAGAARAA